MVLLVAIGGTSSCAARRGVCLLMALIEQGRREAGVIGRAAFILTLCARRDPARVGRHNSTRQTDAARGGTVCYHHRQQIRIAAHVPLLAIALAAGVSRIDATTFGMRR